MERISLVTGANGHLGNCLVRKLVQKGEHVRAGVRDISNTKPFKKVDCHIVHTDLLEPDSLLQALKGVETLYQVAAVYKFWARKPDKEIVQPNLIGTKNIIESAIKCNVKKVIYVSSIAALDKTQTYMNETSWNQNPQNPYYRSKTESEKMALNLAKQHSLFLVSVLPAAMIGPYHSDRITPTMQILTKIMSGKQPIDPCFNINFVSVEDVAEGMMAAEKNGKNGERYILGNESPVCTSALFNLAKDIIPNFKIPPKPSKAILVVLATIMEMVGKLSGRDPDITRSIVSNYYQDQHTLNLSKSRTQLGFNPQDPLTVIRSTMLYLHDRFSLENTKIPVNNK